MNRITVWDLSLRIFHWAFSISMTCALAIALTADKESPIFIYHMLFGLTAGFLLLLRVLVGFLGGRHSRLRALLFKPSEIVRYLVLAPIGKTRRYIGHNPGTAIVAMIMFGLVISLVWTGIAMDGDLTEEIHEVLAYGMLTAIGLHLTGILLHTFHHRENIAMSMVSGTKLGPPEDALRSAGLPGGLVTFAVLVLWVGVLVRGFDPAAPSVTLPVIGTITLGESENEGAEQSSLQHHEDEHEHAEEDD